MREILLAVAVGITFVAACASVAPYGSSGASAQASNGNLYCWKDRLVEDQDKLVCNWAPTRYDACHGTAVTYLERRAVKSPPAQATRCDNGQSLVVVTTG